MHTGLARHHQSRSDKVQWVPGENVWRTVPTSVMQFNADFSWQQRENATVRNRKTARKRNSEKT
jgi:hypothetical protein